MDRNSLPPGKRTEDLFDSLVSNAIDFLQRSVEELEKHPKYSVIHFYMSVELFLKARLLREHWSLVVSKVDQASVQCLRQGDFVSVTMDECLKRLANIANEPLLDHESKCFKALGDHRNKLVHFFHPQYQPPIAPEVLSKIVSEQCKAWCYLYRLLTVTWKGHFAEYSHKISKLHNLVKGNQHFLSAKYEALKPDFTAAKQRGVTFEGCPACAFPSLEAEPVEEPLFHRVCRVCGISGFKFLQLPCPNCEMPVRFEAEGNGECENCDATIDYRYAFDHLAPFEDPKEDRLIGYCSCCTHLGPTAIPFNGRYLCLNCLELHNDAETCGWCGDLIAGPAPQLSTSITGCFRCGGPAFKD